MPRERYHHTRVLRIIPLGGLGEIGMNCLALEEGGEVLVVDCGVAFDGRGLGVDVVHPDFAALDPNRGRLHVFLTHGHEDHIGGVPYFLRRFDATVWGPPYALGLLRERAGEHEVLAHARLVETAPRRVYDVGHFRVEPIRVTHSIADATALAIETAEGTVVHTGDFKFDEEPPDGESFDTERLGAIGARGVALLLSDSTGIDARGGAAGGELGVGRALGEIVDRAEGAVVVGLFASNVHRLRMLGEVAARSGRKIVTLGRSLSTHAKVATETGYLAWPPGLAWPAERVGELERRRVLALATGTQAEPNAALARIARGDHPSFAVRAGDTVVFSSRVIPGNEPGVFGVMADLLRRGVELRTWYSDRDVHVSGHAHPSEQRRMVEMTAPRAFVPVHGTLHHLVRHAALARELGVPEVHVLENGDVLEIEGGRLTRGARVPAGRVHVYAGRAIPPSVLRDRMGLAATGVAFVGVPLDANGSLAGPVWLGTCGIVEGETELVESARAEAQAAVRALDRPTPALVAEEARHAVRRAFARVLGYRPTVQVYVHTRREPE
jgi:ribonuclease J